MHAPVPQVMEESRNKERPKHKANTPEQDTKRSPSGLTKRVPEGLVPSLAPELRKRGGLPGSVVKRRPIVNILTEDENTDQRVNGVRPSKVRVCESRVKKGVADPPYGI